MGKWAIRSIRVNAVALIGTAALLASGAASAPAGAHGIPSGVGAAAGVPGAATVAAPAQSSGPVGSLSGPFSPSSPPAASAAPRPGPVAPGARVIPKRSGTDRATITEAVYYTPAYWGSKPSEDPTAGAAGYIQAADAYWNEATGGRIRVKLGWTAPWTKISLTSREVSTCDRAALLREAAQLVSGGGPRDHVLVNLPYNPACPWVDLEWLSDGSPTPFGLTITNGLIVPDERIIGRAIMHNNGVVATESTRCLDSAGQPVPLSNSCDYGIYDDLWEPASDLATRVGTPHPLSLSWLGALDDSELTQVPVGAPKTLTLNALASATGLRGLWFEMDGYFYILEYRSATGLDAWVDDETFLGSDNVTRTYPGGGLILVRLENSRSTRRVEQIDFHPTGELGGAQRHPGLEPGETYTAPDGLFAIKAVSADSSSATVQISFPGLAKVARWAGADRYVASASISGQSFAPGVATVFLASGEVYTDALSGAPVAGMTPGPVLLTKRDALPSVIATELRRLQPGRIVVLGGPNTVSDAVANAAAASTGATLERWSGADRFATSAAISQQSYPVGVNTAYVASGRVFADALSGAPVAGKAKGPVLLVDTDALPEATARELTRLQPSRIVILGGPNSVSSGVANHLASYAPIERWSGADRYATSAAITAQSYAPGVTTAYIASGRVFSDALSGAPVAGTTSGPVLLVDTTTIPDTVAAELQRLRPRRIVVLGGPATITYGVQAALSRYLAP